MLALHGLLKGLFLTSLLFFGLIVSRPVHAAEPGWQAGFSRVVITPQEPIWLAGYASRTAPAEGKIHDLYARTMALRDAAGKTIILVSTDLIGIPAPMAAFIQSQVKERHGIDHQNLMLTCSHTHCGPALGDRLSNIYFLSEAEYAKVLKYQEHLNQLIVEGIGQALSDLKPAHVSFGNGHAEFASHRRPPIGQGIFDHDVPVLKVTDGQNKIRGIVFGYACHNTTMGFQKFCGDYAGFAALHLEELHPDATALFFSGCGADQNPLPRRKIELAEKYGRMLSLGVLQALRSDLTPLQPQLHTADAKLDLPFEKIPTKEDLEKMAAKEDKYQKSLAKKLLEKLSKGEQLPGSYAYPVQVWSLGHEQLTWIALGGEVTVQYSVRLKQELGKQSTWVTGYANDVMAYIPSEKIRDEGGYEGETSMIYYQIPSKWAPGIEDKIVKQVHTLVQQTHGR